jgi:hypothetical protein
MTSADPTLINCCFCNKPVDLKTAKTNEAGKAVHEECYVLTQTVREVTRRTHHQPRASCLLR